jgi:hypothetical protein
VFFRIDLLEPALKVLIAFKITPDAIWFILFEHSIIFIFLTLSFVDYSTKVSKYLETLIIYFPLVILSTFVIFRAETPDVTGAIKNARRIENAIFS